MHRRGVRGKEKKKNLEIKDGDERFLTDCFPVQALSSSCFALGITVTLSFACARFWSCHQMCDVEQGLSKNGLKSWGLGAVIMSHLSTKWASARQLVVLEINDALGLQRFSWWCSTNTVALCTSVGIQT